ncbi:MAG: hypothetical protein B6I38_02165 [Anaerolineaceae bacterium 4572_5.1]|nr:MAG: hypothetical protein B6I38_02165 [Anaerolineaceae bacterium 4572_5.1]
MIEARTLVRPAVAKDQHEIANLMFFEKHVHRHLDWRAPLDWLGAPLYWVLEENDKVIAVLACPQDQPQITWIRLFVHSGKFSSQAVWNALWDTAKAELEERGNTEVAAITLHGWYQKLLKESGFSNRQQIIMMSWEQHDLPRQPHAQGILIRPMMPDDLPSVAGVDAVAFAPIWQNSLSVLKQAYPQAVVATVAEAEDGIVGYQISTKSPFGAHLARLAVHPESQSRGIASTLLSDLTTKLVKRGIPRLTVNTQDDNLASLALYKKNGFQRTGEEYPLFTFEISASR